MSYNFKEEAYHILGARRELDASGVADRNLRPLRPGDTITTLHYVMTITGDATDYTQVEVDTFTVGASPKVADEDVGDGRYGYYFEFVDPLNNSAWSDMVTYTIQGGDITTSVGRDMFDSASTGSAFAAPGGAMTDALTLGAGSDSTFTAPGDGIADALTGGAANDSGVPFDDAPAGGGIADQLTGGFEPTSATGFEDAPAGGIADQLTR